MSGSGDLLTTCAGAGATIVAIFAGFLITRFLTLSGEIEAARNLVDDLRGRVDLERADAEKASNDFIDWDISWEFTDYRFAEALLSSVRPLSARPMSVAAAKGHLDLERFENDRLETEVQRRIAEAEKVEQHPIWAKLPRRSKYADWTLFREANGLVPGTDLDLLWSVRYDQECDAKQVATLSAYAVPNISVSPGNYAQQREPFERRRDTAREALENAEAELHIAVRQAERLGQPDGLISGLLILAGVFVVTVLPSLLLLAPTPRALSRSQSAWVVIGFLAGVGLLFAYLALFANRLRRGTGVDASVRSGRT